MTVEELKKAIEDGSYVGLKEAFLALVLRMEYLEDWMRRLDEEVEDHVTGNDRY